MSTPVAIPRQPDPRVRKDMPVITWTGSWGTVSIQQALDNHDLGQFLLSAQLSETVQRDDRVATALNTRCKGLLGLPCEVSPSPRGDRRAAKKAAKAIEALWAEEDLHESLVQMLRWCVLMGFALAEVIWTGDSEEWTFSLKVWHPQFVWFNWATRKYQLNTAEGVVEITPGDGKWFLLTPEGEYRSWIQGAIRSISFPWLGRQYAFRDWMRFNEIYGLPIRKAIVPAGTPEDDKKTFIDDIASAGSAMSISCPQGTDGKGYDLGLVEATATGWETFRNATEDADRRITLALLGQNLTTEVSGGSFAAAKVHGQVRQDYLEADERGLMAGFRRQVLRPWAMFNHGDPDLAPVVRFDTAPPDDEKAKADILVQLGSALLNFAQVAPEVDRRALLSSFSLPLHEPGKEPPPMVPPTATPPATPLAPLPGSPPPAADPAPDTEAEGHEQAHVLAVHTPTPASFAQRYVDDAASVARDRAARALAPEVRALLDRISSASSYDEMRAALAKVADGLDVEALAEVTEGALMLSTLTGRYAVRSLESSDASLPGQPVLHLLRHQRCPRRQRGPRGGRRHQLLRHPRWAGR